MDYRIRPMQPSEYSLLRDFLYQAIYLPEGTPPPPRSILQSPDLRVYIQDFGRSPHDRCLVAETAEGLAGAVWSRIMTDYGHIDDHIPSLAIALCSAYRGQGIGTALLTAMLDLLRKAGYPQVSLSVQKANPALRLYRRLGFTTAADHGEELVMACRL